MRDAERTGGSAGRSRIQPSRHRPRASASPRSDPPASGAAASPRGQEPGSRARAPRGRTQPPSAADHHEPLQQGPFLRAFGRGQEQGAPGRGWGPCDRTAPDRAPPALLGSAAERRGGVEAAESSRVSPPCPGLEAPAPAALLALFLRRGPDERRAGVPGAWGPAARAWGRGVARGCRTRPSGQGALLRGHSPLGGAGPQGRGLREQP